jgi:hypothetical protein
MMKLMRGGRRARHDIQRYRQHVATNAKLLAKVNSGRNRKRVLKRARPRRRTRRD